VTLTEIVYRVLEESRNDLMPLEVADLVKNRCSYRSYLKALGEEQNDRKPDPPTMLLSEAANNFRKTFQKWLHGTYGTDYRFPAEHWEEEVALVRYEGRIDEVPIFLETVTSEQYSRGGFPIWMQHVIAARSFLLGSDIAYVVIMDQNTQGWRAWQLSGDFSPFGELIKRDSYYIHTLLRGDGVELGVTSECQICPFENSCDVEEKDAESHPLPRVEYKATLDNGMVTEIEKYLWGLNKKKSGRRTHVIHPSELTTSKCDRKIAYSLQGIEEQQSIDPGLRRIFDMGHAAHDLVQEAIKYTLKDRCELEARCNHDHLKISGSCDIALDEDAVEIKTMSYKGMDKLNKQKPEHEDQATIYATALEKAHLIFMYVNKNTGEIKEFRKKVSRQRWHKLATRASRIIKAVGEGVLPDKINKPYICNKCKYRWHCKPEITGSGKRSFKR
jgi:CRISPR/Cas system-associated exonuclease Cas4 (RecB family)